jgi:hypothetical protein
MIKATNVPSDGKKVASETPAPAAPPDNTALPRWRKTSSIDLVAWWDGDSENSLDSQSKISDKYKILKVCCERENPRAQCSLGMSKLDAGKGVG